MDRADGKRAELGATSPPPPARAGMEPVAEPTGADPSGVASEAHVTVEGERWTVRVLGRGGSRKAPLLLLGFFDAGEASLPRRESLVVARSLEDLTELQLDVAWRAGVTPRPPGTARPFFAEVAARGGKEG